MSTTARPDAGKPGRARADQCRPGQARVEVGQRGRGVTARKSAFKTNDLTKTYVTGEVVVHALRGVSLEILEGEILALLGPSGSGKSTLLNILGGLDHATSGTVRFREHVLSAMTDCQLTRFRRDHVGFVFQFYNLIPSLTALENVALVTEIASHPLDPLEALDLVRLKDRAGHFPSQLSGGEQQRVAIARAIAKQPEVLLCDEPTGALDSHTGIVVLEALLRVNTELDTTVALITHNAGISGIADRVVRFSDGRIASIEENSERKNPAELVW